MPSVVVTAAPVTECRGCAAHACGRASFGPSQPPFHVSCAMPNFLFFFCFFFVRRCFGPPLPLQWTAHIIRAVRHFLPIRTAPAVQSRNADPRCFACTMPNVQPPRLFRKAAAVQGGPKPQSSLQCSSGAREVAQPSHYGRWHSFDATRFGACCCRYAQII